MDNVNFKETRKLQIRDKIFKVDDLKRLASVLEDQSALAKNKEQHYSISYELHFSDDTIVESRTFSILEDDILFTSKRPLLIQFLYHNNDLNKRISLSLDHGDFPYRNSIIVSGQESEWVNDVFARLNTILQGVTPQESFVNRHPTLLLNIIALGVGTFGYNLINIIMDYTTINFDLAKHIAPIQEGSFLHSLSLIIRSHIWFFYGIGWILKWFLGFAWGAFEVRRWFLDLWPSIELDIGPEHLKIEKNKRKKVYAVIVPIATALLYDVVKLFV